MNKLDDVGSLMVEVSGRVGIGGTGGTKEVS